MCDDRCPREETVAPCEICMIMCIDHITYRHIQFMLDEFADAECFIWQSQLINHHRPLWPSHHTRGYLGINFALEPKDVFRYSFAMHSTLVKFFLLIAQIQVKIKLTRQIMRIFVILALKSCLPTHF